MKVLLEHTDLRLGVGADGDGATGGRDVTGACCRGCSIVQLERRRKRHTNNVLRFYSKRCLVRPAKFPEIDDGTY